MSDTPNEGISRRRQQVLDDALVQLRATRAQLDPALLARVRALIGDRTLMDLIAPTSDARVADDRMPLPAGAQPWNPAITKADDAKAGFEPIDRRRNLHTIRLFLEMQPGNKDVQSKVRTLMSEYFN